MLATCLVGLGEYDAVPALCEEAIRLADDTRDRLANAVAHRALAEALDNLPFDTGRAEVAVLAAISIQQELGSQPELARSYVTYARLLNRWRRTDEARRYFVEAVDMFRRMGMTRDVDRAEREAAALA